MTRLVSFRTLPVVPRCILVTRNAHDPATRTFLEACGCRHLVKPFEPDRLTAAAGTVVRRMAVKET